jgi:hypothetical protein
LFDHLDELKGIAHGCPPKRGIRSMITRHMIRASMAGGYRVEHDSCRARPILIHERKLVRLSRTQ